MSISIKTVRPHPSQPPSNSKSTAPASPKPIVVAPAPPTKPVVKVNSTLQSQELLRSIEAGSQEIQKLATELSTRIIRFEKWLGKLPGRIETEFYSNATPEENGFALQLKRESGIWRLFFSQFNPEYDDPREPVKWRGLIDASVEIKARALEIFPQFLREIAKEQQKKITTLRRVHQEFDSFAESLPTLEEEGDQDVSC